MAILAYRYCSELEAAEPVSWPQPVDRVYQDMGGRSQLAALYTDCRRDPQAIETVVVQRFADLGDSLDAVQGWWAKFSQLQVALVSVQEGAMPSGAIAGMVLAQQVQQQQQQRRIRRGHAERRVAGKPPPGKAPYGYRRGPHQYLIDRSAAAIVRAFFDHFLLYASLRQSVRYLAQNHGKTISTSTAHRWLTSPVYRGDLAYKNGDVVPNTHTAILSRDEAAQVDRLLRRNRPFSPRSRSAPRSLAGLVRCGRCQAPLVVSKTVHRRGRRRIDYLYLRPRQCPYRHSEPPSLEPAAPIRCVALPYEAVLDAVIARICEELPPSVNQTGPSPMVKVGESIAQQIKDKQALILQVEALQDQGVLDEQTAMLRTYKLKTETAALQAQLGQLPPASLLSIAETISIPQFWRDLSESERRFYFREFIDTIDVTRREGGWIVTLSYRFKSPPQRPSE